MSAARYVIEGEWSGYIRSQQHVAHRKVYPASRRLLRAWVEKTHGIRFTDGTMLLLSVRDCKPRERIEEKNGYGSLIDDCAYYDATSVDDLAVAMAAARAKTRAAWDIRENAP